MVDPYAPDETVHTDRRPVWVDRSGGGIWWLVAAVGIGLLLLAYVIAFFDGRTHSAQQVFAMLGFLALEVGLTLTAYLGVSWHWGARVALMLGAAFLALRMVTPGVLLF